MCAYARQTVPASSYRKTTEIIREFPGEGQELRRLMNLAHPMAPDDVREILATEQFLDGCIKRRCV